MVLDQDNIIYLFWVCGRTYKWLSHVLLTSLIVWILFEYSMHDIEFQIGIEILWYLASFFSC